MGMLKAFIVAASVALAWPAAAQDIVCHDPLKPMLRAELFFGRNIGGQPDITERQWLEFVTRELTARFPDGLTMIDGLGQWRDSGGAIVREPAKIVIIVTANDASVGERVAAATAAYKLRFQQTSVGVVMQPVCAAF